MKKKPLLKQVVAAFIIYFAVAFFAMLYLQIALFALKILREEFFNSDLNLWFFAVFASLQALCVLYYSFKMCPFKPVLLRWGKILKDVGVAILAWLIGFPVILAVAGLLAVLLSQFGYTASEQEVIGYVRQASDNPLLFGALIFVVAFVVPVMEEVMFRGFLQTFLSRFFRKTPRIFFTSLVFALFHFGAVSGAWSIVLLSSIFILSLFSSFLYERQKSLLAPITLHVIFNAVNIVLVNLGS